MTCIKINEAEALDIKLIRSYNASQREVPQSKERETVLTITKTDGENLSLYGELAEAALSILRQHGC